MTSSYQKILKKITDTEKRLKPNKCDINAIVDYEMTERTALACNEDDVIDEYKILKENICGGFSGSFALAYNPIRIKNRKWSQQDL